MSVQDKVRFQLGLSPDVLPDEDITDWGNGVWAAWDGGETRSFYQDSTGAVAEIEIVTVHGLSILKAKALDNTVGDDLVDTGRDLLKNDPRLPHISTNADADRKAYLALLIQWGAMRGRIDENGDIYVWQSGQSQADEIKVT